MVIKKFQGKTEEEAIALAKKELGANVTIMNVKNVTTGKYAGDISLKGFIYNRSGCDRAHLNAG